jgi:hypothetical protein
MPRQSPLRSGQRWIMRQRAVQAWATIQEWKQQRPSLLLLLLLLLVLLPQKQQQHQLPAHSNLRARLAAWRSLHVRCFCSRRGAPSVPASVVGPSHQGRTTWRMGRLMGSADMARNKQGRRPRRGQRGAPLICLKGHQRHSAWWRCDPFQNGWPPPYTRGLRLSWPSPWLHLRRHAGRSRASGMRASRRWRQSCARALRQRAP